MNYNEHTKLLSELRNMPQSEIVEYLRERNTVNESTDGGGLSVRLPHGMTVEEYAKNNHFLSLEECVERWG